MNIGVVLFIGISNVTTDAVLALTDTKPEWIPAALASVAWMARLRERGLRDRVVDLREPRVTIVRHARDQA